MKTCPGVCDLVSSIDRVVLAEGLRFRIATPFVRFMPGASVAGCLAFCFNVFAQPFEVFFPVDCRS